MKQLPQEFENRMKILLGDEFEDFQKSFDEPPVRAFRVNTDKTSLEDFEKINPFGGEKIPYVPNGFYFDYDGICTINFAYTSDDIIYYSDLIKVSVSLDKNEVVSVDCTGYLMNHKKRDVPEDIISVETAKQSISEVLSVKDRKTAFIPMNDGSEVFTYEFLCNDKNGNDVLVYINAVTGDEADIKLLLYSDNGTLTR
jgi:hypothetical protein